MARSTEKSDSQTAVKEVPAERPVQRNYFSTSNQKGVLYGLLAFVVLLIVFAAGAAAANHHRAVFRTASFVGGPGTASAGPMRGGHERGFMTSGNFNTDGQSRVMGVVTSVNGSGFTVAGNGSTTNVTTNSSTQYQGGNSVKQNDTVLVRGTSSSGNITAAQVVINP